MTKAVIVDLDGTVALMGKGEPGRRGPYDWHRVGEDDPNEPVIELVGLFRKARYQIVFVSGRDEVCRSQTDSWLLHHSVAQAGEPLFMRTHGDNRPDEEVKAEIYQKYIQGYWNVAYVLDDRDKVVRMWRGLDLTVLAVAEGNF